MRRFVVLLSGLVLLNFTSDTLGQVLSIAHRGNSLFAPENTVAAFTAALGKGDMVETDGRVTSDGVLVIMHDATVDRTTDGTGSISSLTLAQLKLLDAGSWFSGAFVGERIPTLEEMITNSLPDAIPLIEQKAGPASVYVSELQRLGVTTNVVLQSFDWNFLSAVHALDPSILLCALGSGNLTATALTNMMNTGASTVAWEKGGVTVSEVSMVHGAGMKLFVWTVDSGPEIQSFINLGMDGIISNDPATVKGLQQPVTNTPAYLGERLVSYWKLDDGLTDAFGTFVADSKGGNTGTLVRNDGLSHWISNAKFSGGFQAAGNAAFVNIPTSLNAGLWTNELTISAWVQLSQLPAQLPENFGGIFDSAEDSYVLYLDKGNNELRFKVTDATGNAARPGINASLLTTNQWLHVVGTFNGHAYPASGEATIYLNGIARDTHIGNDGGAATGLIGNIKTGQVAAIGRNGAQTVYPFTGTVDDIAIWNRSLSPVEISRVFEAGQAGQNLADLLIQPDPLLQITSAGLNAAGTQLEINFHNDGSWQTFQLRRATNWNSPYFPVPGLAPTSIGSGNYRFIYPLNPDGVEYFRIEGF